MSKNDFSKTPLRFGRFVSNNIATDHARGPARKNPDASWHTVFVKYAIVRNGLMYIRSSVRVREKSYARKNVDCADLLCSARAPVQRRRSIILIVPSTGARTTVHHVVARNRIDIIPCSEKRGFSLVKNYIRTHGVVSSIVVEQFFGTRFTRSNFFAVKHLSFSVGLGHELLLVTEPRTRTRRRGGENKWGKKNRTRQHIVIRCHR